MLSPKRVKFRKRFKGRTTGLATAAATVAFGTTACRRSSRGGSPTGRSRPRVWRSRVTSSAAARSGSGVFPDKPITKKPAETRMGKGKGSPEMWVAVVKPGRVMFELEGVDARDRREGDGAGGGEDAGARRSSWRARRRTLTKLTTGRFAS